MLEERRSEETVARLVEKAGDDGSVMPLLGLAFWRMKHAFEREVGLSAATWFLLTTLRRRRPADEGLRGKWETMAPAGA